MDCIETINPCQAYAALKRAELDLALGQAVASVSLGSEKTTFKATDRGRMTQLIAEYGRLCGDPCIVTELRGGNRVPPAGVCFAPNVCASCKSETCGCGC